MRDLYKSVGLKSRAVAISEIEQAISVARSRGVKMASVAEDILLNDTRRPHYDRVHSALKTIGEVRANIGCSYGPNWTGSGCGDFDTRPTSPSQLKEFDRPPQVDRESTAASIGLKPFLVSGLIILLVGSLAVFNANSTSPSTVAPRSGPARPSPIPEAPRGSRPAASPPIQPSFEEQEAARINKVRDMVLGRIERAGLQPDSTVEEMVRRIASGDALPLPVTGVVTTSFFDASGVAPLEIVTSQGLNYFVKVVDWKTKEQILTAFVRGGDYFETHLPIGSYEIRYASGDSWFGPVFDFGEGAVYAKCDDRFDFTRTISGYNGYTVELIRQVGGNLETLPIGDGDF